eukprot:m.64105 g.64105  ORF g.64105 m.64105 type:complete len:1652 (+) comp11990_c0_seq3:191-5146(+)
MASLKALRRQRAAAAKDGDLPKERRILCEIGLFHAQEGDTKACHDALHEAIALGGEDDPLVQRSLADAYRVIDDYSGELRHRKRHLELAQASGDQVETQRALINLAGLYIDCKDPSVDDPYTKAIQLLITAAKQINALNTSKRQREDETMRCFYNCGLALMRRDRGRTDLEAAWFYLSEALTKAKAIMQRSFQVEIQLQIAELLCKSGADGAAVDMYRKSIQLSTTNKDPLADRFDAIIALASLHAAFGREQQAFSSLRELYKQTRVPRVKASLPMDSRLVLAQQLKLHRSILKRQKELVNYEREFRVPVQAATFHIPASLAHKAYSMMMLYEAVADHFCELTLSRYAEAIMYYANAAKVATLLLQHADHPATATSDERTHTHTSSAASSVEGQLPPLQALLRKRVELFSSVALTLLDISSHARAALVLKKEEALRVELLEQYNDQTQVFHALDARFRCGENLLKWSQSVQPTQDADASSATSLASPHRDSQSQLSRAQGQTAKSLLGAWNVAEDQFSHLQRHLSNDLSLASLNDEQAASQSSLPTPPSPDQSSWPSLETKPLDIPPETDRGAKRYHASLECVLSADDQVLQTILALEQQTPACRSFALKQMLSSCDEGSDLVEKGQLDSVKAWQVVAWQTQLAPLLDDVSARDALLARKDVVQKAAERMDEVHEGLSDDESGQDNDQQDVRGHEDDEESELGTSVDLTDSDPEREERERAALALKEHTKLTKLNAQGETPLQEACKKGQYVNVHSLLSKGAPVNCQDYAGWTPLHDAVDANALDIVELLLEHDSLKPNVQSHEEGYTALHTAVRKEDTAILRALLERGLDYTVESSDFETPLELAANLEQEDAFYELKRFLQEKGTAPSNCDTLDDCVAAWQQKRLQRLAERAHETQARDKAIKAVLVPHAKDDPTIRARHVAASDVSASQRHTRQSHFSPMISLEDIAWAHVPSRLIEHNPVRQRGIEPARYAPTSSSRDTDSSSDGGEHGHDDNVGCAKGEQDKEGDKVGSTSQIAERKRIGNKHRRRRKKQGGDKLQPLLGVAVGDIDSWIVHDSSSYESEETRSLSASDNSASTSPSTHRRASGYKSDKKAEKVAHRMALRERTITEEDPTLAQIRRNRVQDPSWSMSSSSDDGEQDGGMYGPHDISSKSAKRQQPAQSHKRQESTSEGELEAGSRDEAHLLCSDDVYLQRKSLFDARRKKYKQPFKLSRSSSTHSGTDTSQATSHGQSTFGGHSVQRHKKGRSAATHKHSHSRTRSSKHQAKRQTASNPSGQHHQLSSHDTVVADTSSPSSISSDVSDVEDDVLKGDGIASQSMYKSTYKSSYGPNMPTSHRADRLLSLSTSASGASMRPQSGAKRLKQRIAPGPIAVVQVAVAASFDSVTVHLGEIVIAIPDLYQQIALEYKHAYGVEAETSSFAIVASPQGAVKDASFLHCQSGSFFDKQNKPVQFGAAITIAIGTIHVPPCTEGYNFFSKHVSSFDCWFPNPSSLSLAAQFNVECLQTLSISASPLPKRMLASLFQLLRHHGANLVELDVSCNRLIDAMSELTHTVWALTSLRVLRLDSCGLHAKDVQELLSATKPRGAVLTPFRSLQHLSMNMNMLSGLSFPFLTTFLDSHPSIIQVCVQYSECVAPFHLSAHHQAIILTK